MKIPALSAPRRLLLCPLLILLLGGCVASDHESVSVDTLYLNAALYDVTTGATSAKAFAVSDTDIVFVGSAEEARRTLTAATTIDLGGRFVMPGIIDSHAHPGLVALIGELEDPDAGLPTDTKENFFSALSDYAELLKDEPLVVLGSWDVAMFLPDGPNKRDLDAIFPDQPVVLTDNSGHSTWMNSVALAMFGVTKDTKDLSPGVSVFARDESGEPTGWVKEFTLMRQIGKTLLRPAPEIKSRLQYYLSYLSEHGVTTLWDAGNFENDDEIYAVLQEMEQEGTLPVKYEGSYHIFDPAQIDKAIAELLRLRESYGGKRLQFNSIKVHYDGVVEVGTAGMLDSYIIEEDNRGGFLFTAERLAEFLLQLDEHDIDIHLHSVGDGATREILDAVEMVQDRGTKLGIEVTISHLEHVSEDDFPRFAELSVHANFTPHWWGGTYFGDAGERYVGAEAIHRSQDGRALFELDANVTFSSDVTTLSAHHRANPFVGIQMAVTRQEFDLGPDANVFGPESARVTREQAIAAYTINGARQLGRESEIGSIEVGMQADFLVLPESLLTRETYSIAQLKPDAVFLNGTAVAGTPR